MFSSNPVAKVGTKITHLYILYIEKHIMPITDALPNRNTSKILRNQSPSLIMNIACIYFEVSVRNF